jgi:hypothetical protein
MRKLNLLKSFGARKSRPGGRPGAAGLGLTRQIEGRLKPATLDLKTGHQGLRSGQHLLGLE